MKNSIFAIQFTADVVELVDTLDLGSSAARRGGSTPFTRTIYKWYKFSLYHFWFKIENKLWMLK